MRRRPLMVAAIAALLLLLTTSAVALVSSNGGPERQDAQKTSADGPASDPSAVPETQDQDEETAESGEPAEEKPTDEADASAPKDAAESGKKSAAKKPAPKKAEKPEQWRSYWVDSFRDSIYTPENVDEVVADAEKANANVLIVQVSRWMDCYCDKSSFPRTEAGIEPGFDPLEDVVEKAHAAGIQVHAWVNTTPVWNAPDGPENPDHVANKHGEDADGWDNWLNQRADGGNTAGEDLINLDPANPAAVRYLVEGVESIVREYDVDGVNLDYIRYPDNETTHQSDWGYSEASLDRFHEATGRSDKPKPTDEEFSDWRRDQVTAMVRKIYLTMYEANPQAALSVNAITHGHGPQSEGGWSSTRTYSEVMQDWRSWMKEGIVDVNTAMNYKAEAGDGDRAQMFDEWNEVLADWQFDRLAVVGPGLYMNSVEDSVAQARRALQATDEGNKLAGWSGYAYAAPSSDSGADLSGADAERDKLAEALTEDDPSGREPLFGKDAAVPELSWKTEPTTGQVVGSLKDADGEPLDQVDVELTQVDTGEKVSARQSDGSGWFGAANLEPGQWKVEAELPGRDSAEPVVVDVSAGEVSTATIAPGD